MLHNMYLYFGLLHHPSTIVCLGCLSHRLQIKDYSFIVPDKFVLCAELVRYNIITGNLKIFVCLHTFTEVTDKKYTMYLLITSLFIVLSKEYLKTSSTVPINILFLFILRFNFM